MTISLKKIAAAALISIGAMSAIPASASAAGVDFYFGIGGPGPYFHGGHHGHGGYGPGRHWGHRRGCSDYRALRKARYNYGLRHARIVHSGFRGIVVEGRRHHHHSRIVFANAPGCPVVRY